MITIRSRTIGIAVATLLLGWGLAGRGTAVPPGSPTTPSVIQANRFELLDSTGKVRAILGLSDKDRAFLQVGGDEEMQLRIGRYYLESFEPDIVWLMPTRKLKKGAFWHGHPQVRAELSADTVRRIAP